MEGSICLIKLVNGKVVPALCIKTKGDNLFFAQIRMANEEDIFNAQSRIIMEKQNKGKKELEQIKIREKYQINTVYIGQPIGLKSKSVVMVNRIYELNSSKVIKRISIVNFEVVESCLKLIKQVKEINSLHQELKLIKNKIKLAQMNNERYSNYEKRVDEILTKIGYPLVQSKKNTPYLNYREVPTKGYIKVYKGGR